MNGNRKLGDDYVATEYNIKEPIVKRLDARALKMSITGGAGLDRALLVDAMLAVARLLDAAEPIVNEVKAIIAKGDSKTADKFRPLLQPMTDAIDRAFGKGL